MEFGSEDLKEQASGKLPANQLTIFRERFICIRGYSATNRTFYSCMKSYHGRANSLTSKAWSQSTRTYSGQLSREPEQHPEPPESPDCVAREKFSFSRPPCRNPPLRSPHFSRGQTLIKRRTVLLLRGNACYAGHETSGAVTTQPHPLPLTIPHRRSPPFTGHGLTSGLNVSSTPPWHMSPGTLRYLEKPSRHER